jgi:hypothetical protein
MFVGSALDLSHLKDGLIRELCRCTATIHRLEKRLGRLHAKLRLGIELDHEAQIFGQGINFFHIENWYSVHSVIRTTLKLMGLYWRGRKNAEQIQVRHNHISMKTLPSRFDGFTLLHISDLHVDMNEGAMRRLTELLPDLTYDVCVLTGEKRTAAAASSIALTEFSRQLLVEVSFSRQQPKAVLRSAR